MNMDAYFLQLIDKKEVRCISRSYELSDGSCFNVKDYSAVGNDDDFYDKYGYDTLLKRGTVCVEWEGYQRWVFALPKFGYEDEAVREGEAVVWYFTQKENGECGHIAFLDANHVLIGSKNVHIVINVARYEDDLRLYSAMNDQRLKYAIRIAKLMQHHVWDCDLIAEMVRTNMVLVMEALFNNHIVSYASEGYRVIAFVKDGKVMSPALMREMCVTYALHCVRIDVATTSQEYTTLRSWYTDPNNSTAGEGAVVYKEVDGCVTGLYKLKNPVYVVKRAARELIKRRATKQQWDARFQKLHVPFTDAQHKELLRFYGWILKTYPNYTSDFIQENFTQLWEKFVATSETTEEPIILPDERNVGVTVLGFIGIPGSGKTTLSTTVEQTLVERGYKVTRINQDELCKNRKQFIQRLTRIADTWDDGYVLVDKVNHTTFLRDDVEGLFANVYWFAFTCDDMVDTCVQRIQRRGIYHPSLVYSYETRGILERFANEMVLPDTYTPVSMAHTTCQQVNTVLRVCEIAEEVSVCCPSLSSIRGTILYWKIDVGEGKHVTLVYKPSEEDTTQLMPHFGSEVDVVVDCIVHTNDVRVAKVRRTAFLDTYCKNRHPHITLWTRDGVKPVEANRVLEAGEGTVEVTEGLTYKGIITVELK